MNVDLVREPRCSGVGSGWVGVYIGEANCGGSVFRLHNAYAFAS
jgi:hypothetical protein